MDYIAQLQYLQQLLPFTGIDQQIKMCLQVITSLQQHHLPSLKLPPLGITDVQFVNAMLVNNSDQQYDYLRQCDHLLRNFRSYLEVKFGMWAYISNAFLDEWIKQFGNLRYLEIMAGNGFISAGLRQRHQQVICTDNFAWRNESETGRQPWTPMIAMDALQAVNTYASQVDAIIMSWSPDGNDIDWQVLQVLRQYHPQPLLFCIGERNGATNSKIFWQKSHSLPDRRLLKVNAQYAHFDLMRDRLYLIQ